MGPSTTYVTHPTATYPNMVDVASTTFGAGFDGRGERSLGG